MLNVDEVAHSFTVAFYLDFNLEQKLPFYANVLDHIFFTLVECFVRAICLPVCK